LLWIASAPYAISQKNMRVVFLAALLALACGDYVRQVYNTSDCTGSVVEYEWVSDTTACTPSTVCKPDFQYGGKGTRLQCTKGGPVAAPAGFVTFTTFQYQPTCTGPPHSVRGLALNTCHVFESQLGVEGSRYTCDGSALTLRSYSGQTDCKGQYFQIRTAVNCSLAPSSDSAVMTACT
jgi:hypothetical protein